MYFLINRNSEIITKEMIEEIDDYKFQGLICVKYYNDNNIYIGNAGEGHILDIDIINEMMDTISAGIKKSFESNEDIIYVNKKTKIIIKNYKDRIDCKLFVIDEMSKEFKPFLYNGDIYVARNTYKLLKTLYINKGNVGIIECDKIKSHHIETIERYWNLLKIEYVKINPYTINIDATIKFLKERSEKISPAQKKAISWMLQELKKYGKETRLDLFDCSKKSANKFINDNKKLFIKYTNECAKRKEEYENYKHELREAEKNRRHCDYSNMSNLTCEDYEFAHLKD